jgi:D-proline reductase (dithiol) PrdB
MARLDRILEPMRSVIAALECPNFKTQHWIKGPPLTRRRVAIISTAGLHRRDDRSFTIIACDYRIIPGDIKMNDLVMSHTSTNFDRTGFQQDWNVVFPLDRLRELTDQGLIGSIADFHYSFMAATDPKLMEPMAHDLVPLKI